MASLHSGFQETQHHASAPPRRDNSHDDRHDPIRYGVGVLLALVCLTPVVAQKPRGENLAAGGVVVEAEGEANTAGAAAAPSRPFGPLPIRIADPVSLLFYRPLADRAETLREGRWELHCRWHHAAISDQENLPGSEVEFDGEIFRWELALDYGVTDDLELSLTLPFHYTTGGFMDRISDDFHDLTGLDRTGDTIKDQFNMRGTRDGRTFIDLPDDTFELVDIPITLKYAVLREPEAPLGLAVRAGGEIPTGDGSRSLGSGGFEGGVGFILEKSWRQFSAYLAVDGVFAETPPRFDRAGVDIRPVLLGSFALEWRPLHWMAVLAQIDAATGVVSRSDVRILSREQVQGAFGVAFRLWDEGTLRVGFTEDLSNAAVPDIAVFLGLSQGF